MRTTDLIEETLSRVIEIDPDAENKLMLVLSPEAYSKLLDQARRVQLGQDRIQSIDEFVSSHAGTVEVMTNSSMEEDIRVYKLLYQDSCG